MNWIVLFIAGVFEVAMTFCLGKTKGAQGTELYLWIGGFFIFGSEGSSWRQC